MKYVWAKSRSLVAFVCMWTMMTLLGSCERWIPRCVEKRPQLEVWHRAKCDQRSSDEMVAKGDKSRFSGDWYALPDKMFIEHNVGHWHRKDELWSLSTYPNDDDSNETFLDEGEDPVLAIDKHGNLDGHFPALGFVERYHVWVDASSQRKNWGTVAWIIDEGVDDGDSAHLCLHWSEVCTTSTSLERQYEAVYVYADVVFGDDLNRCERIRVRAHEILTLVDDALHVDATATGTCEGNGARVRFRTHGILNREPNEPWRRGLTMQPSPRASIGTTMTDHQ